MAKIFFVVVLATAILFSVQLANTQPTGKNWRIGLFHVGLDHVPPSLEPLRQELKKLGYEEGRNLQLDWQVCGFCAFQNFIHVGGGTPV